jgi:hypothetical protein
VPNPAFELQGAPAGARGIDTGMGARPNSGGMWVQTPPLNPGQTLGVDIYVAPLDKAKRKGLVTFNVTSGPAEAAGVDMTTDAVSVRLTGAR